MISIRELILRKELDLIDYIALNKGSPLKDSDWDLLFEVYGIKGELHEGYVKLLHYVCKEVDSRYLWSKSLPLLTSNSAENLSAFLDKRKIYSDKLVEAILSFNGLEQPALIDFFNSEIISDKVDKLLLSSLNFQLISQDQCREIIQKFPSQLRWSYYLKYYSVSDAERLTIANQYNIEGNLDPIWMRPGFLMACRQKKYLTQAFIIMTLIVTGSMLFRKGC